MNPFLKLALVVGAGCLTGYAIGTTLKKPKIDHDLLSPKDEERVFSSCIMGDRGYQTTKANASPARTEMFSNHVSQTGRYGDKGITQTVRQDVPLKQELPKIFFDKELLYSINNPEYERFLKGRSQEFLKWYRYFVLGHKPRGQHLGLNNLDFCKMSVRETEAVLSFHNLPVNVQESADSPAPVSNSSNASNEEGSGPCADVMGNGQEDDEVLASSLAATTVQFGSKSSGTVMSVKTKLIKTALYGRLTIDGFEFVTDDDIEAVEQQLSRVQANEVTIIDGDISTIGYTAEEGVVQFRLCGILTTDPTNAIMAFMATKSIARRHLVAVKELIASAYSQDNGE
jgi:hypothetical protein